MKSLSKYQNGTPLYFAHIPKSGGTTLTMLLERVFPLSEIFPPKLLWEVGKIDATSQKPYRLFRGHFNALSHILAFQKTQSITLLRDPIEMAISSFNHVKRDPNTRWHDVVMKENWTFDDFINHPNTQNITTNRMTNFLHVGVTAPCTEEALNLTSSSFRRLKRSVKRYQRDQLISDKTTLAQGYLKHCFWVGVLEQLDLSLKLFCYLMALPPMKTQPRLNQSKQKPIISANTRQLLIERNQSDYSLYEWACKQLEVLGHELESKDEHGLTPEAIDQNYQENYLKVHHKERSKEVSLLMTDGMIGDQWHQREWNDEAQSWFRWSGPSSVSFIDFWLISKDFQLTVILLKSPKSEQLRLVANGTELKFVTTHNEKQWTLKASINRGMIRANGLLRLEFDVQTTVSYQSGNDEINVGVALKQISIK